MKRNPKLMLQIFTQALPRTVTLSNSYTFLLEAFIRFFYFLHRGNRTWREDSNIRKMDYCDIYELIIKVTDSKCCSAKTKRLTGHYKKRGRKKGADRRRTGAKLN